MDVWVYAQGQAGTCRQLEVSTCLCRGVLLGGCAAGGHFACNQPCVSRTGEVSHECGVCFVLSMAGPAIRCMLQGLLTRTFKVCAAQHVIDGG